MISTHRIVMHDTFDIATRIREIDPDYFIVRNYKTQKFELHAKNKRGGSLCLVLPYNSLDARTLTYARRTRAERAVTLIAEMQTANEKLNKRQANAIVSKAFASS